MKNNYTNNSSQNSNFAHGPGDRDVELGQKSKPKKFLGSNINPHKIPFQISEAKFGGIFFLENYAAATNLQNVLNTPKIPT